MHAIIPWVLFGICVLIAADKDKKLKLIKRRYDLRSKQLNRPKTAPPSYSEQQSQSMTYSKPQNTDSGSNLQIFNSESKQQQQPKSAPVVNISPKPVAGPENMPVTPIEHMKNKAGEYFDDAKKFWAYQFSDEDQYAILDYDENIIYDENGNENVINIL